MDKLPPEMLLKIAQNLSPDDLVSLSGANQRIFATIANDKLLWQQQLKEAKFPSCSELKKLIPMDSGNCQEKDEFLLQKRLHQNWKTGNFQIIDITQPPADRNFSLGCKYNDFVMWYATKGTNTWHLFWFDVEVDTGFQSATFSYPVKTSEPPWSVPDWQISQIEALSKTVIILHLFHFAASEIVAIDISEPNDPRIMWQSRRDWSDDRRWIVNVMNETIFIMKTTADSVASIDLYDANSGEHVKTFHHALISNGVTRLFGDESRKHRSVSERCDYIPLGWFSHEDWKIHLMTLNVNNLDLKLLKKINFGHKYKHSGERFSYIDYERNGHWSVEVLSLVSGKLIASIQSRGLLMCHEFTNDESLFAFEETTENNIRYYLHRSGSEEKKCEVTTTATELRKVHRECLIAIDNRDQGTGVSISINSFNNDGEVATETRKPLPHPYTTQEDRAFKVRELVLLTSVALARFKNKVGANFWMVLDFKP